MAISAVASLSFLTGGAAGIGRSSLAVSKPPTWSSSMLRSSFLSCPSTSLSFPSAFSGISLGIDLRCNSVIRPKHRRSLQVTAAGKKLLCMTKRNKSRKSLARVHGFRRRMRTTSGRAVLQRRRAKGRKILCTKTNPNSGPRGGR